MAGGGLLPAYVRGPLDERLRVIPEPPVAGRRLVVVRGEPGTGTSRAGWQGVAGVLAGWPPGYLRTAAALDAAGRIKRRAVGSAWLSGNGYLCCWRGWGRLRGRPSGGGAGPAGGPITA